MNVKNYITKPQLLIGYTYPVAEHILALSEQKLTEQGSRQFTLLILSSGGATVDVLVQFDVFNSSVVGDGEGTSSVNGDSDLVVESVVGPSKSDVDEEAAAYRKIKTSFMR